MYMNVNGIKFYNTYDIDTNDKCQSNKPVKFCGSKDAYVSSEKKKNEASKKRKRNWIIAGVCTAVVATVTGFLYFNGKKVKKTSNVVEHAKNQVSEISQNSIKKYADYLKQDNIKASVLRTNIKEMEGLLKQNPNDDIATNIITNMNNYYLELINKRELGVSERIQDLNDYNSFLDDYFKETDDYSVITALIKANTECLEYERDIEKKDIDKNIANLSKVITNNNIGTIYQQEFIETLLDKERRDERNTTQILNTIAENTNLNNEYISNKESETSESIIERCNDPTKLMLYLQALNYKNIKTNNTKIDNSLLQYNILTVGKLKEIIQKTIKDNKSSLSNYYLNNENNILYYKENNQEVCSFDFQNQQFFQKGHVNLENPPTSSSQITKEPVNLEPTPSSKKNDEPVNLENPSTSRPSSLKPNETIDKDAKFEAAKTEFEETLKNKTLEEKRKAIVEIFSTYSDNFDAIETLLGIINENTSNDDIEKAKQEALQAFNDSLKDDSADNVIKALQSTVDTLYKKDNYYSGLLQDCLVNLNKCGKNIQDTPECRDFDNNNIGLVYGLGVCRHMAKLVKYLITNSNLKNVQVCSVDNGSHAWNYLRFKNVDNSYTDYKVDTYFRENLKLDNDRNGNGIIENANKSGISGLDDELLLNWLFTAP